MRIKKNRVSRKKCLRTMAILMASVMILSAGGQLVQAKSEKYHVEAVQADKNEEKMIVYLNGKSGKDKRNGEDWDSAVKSFKRAKELAGEYGVIRICGTVTVKGDQTWELPSGVAIRRAADFDGPLVKVKGSLVLENVILYEDDITGDGTVEGARVREKVHVPEVITLEEPVALSEVALTECEGDGVFAWTDEEFVPSEYETSCTVVFHPYDTEAVDYSEEKGWETESKSVIREILVRVEALKEVEPEVTPEATPEPTPETTPEATPEPTPEATPEPTPEATPEVTPEATPEVTPETTPEATPEVTPETTPEATPEVTPETTPEATPEVTPETTPEVTPEVTPVPVPEVVLTQEQIDFAYAVQAWLFQLPTQITTQEMVQSAVDATRTYEALIQEQKDLIAEEAKANLLAVQNAVAVYNRQSNGAYIEGEFPWYVQFQVELKNDKNDTSILQDQNVDTFITPYDMKLWDLMNNVEYQLNGQQVKVTVPAPDGELYTQLVVVHYLEDGTVEYITPVNNNDGTMSFITTSFSPYNIAGSKPLVGHTDKVYESGNKKPGGGLTQKPSGSSHDKKPVVNKKPNGTGTLANGSTYKPSLQKPSGNRVPATGDEQPVALYLGIAGGAILMLAIIGIILKKKRK